MIVPFPMTILALIGLYMVCKAKREKTESRFFTNMICVLSVLETISIISIIIYAEQYGVYLTLYLSLGAGFFLYGLNIFFTIIYVTQIRKDSAFKYCSG